LRPSGLAAACLRIARLDPTGPWYRQALELTLSTLLVERQEWLAAGLYGGEAAIPWLALSLISGNTSGPPGLDFIEGPGTRIPLLAAGELAPTRKSARTKPREESRSRPRPR
jgi:hypothetical protein